MAVIVAGVFPSRDQAEGALQTLTNCGFPRESLGVALRVNQAAAARKAGVVPPPSATWLPHHRIVNLKGMGDTLVAGILEECWPKDGSTTPLADALSCLGIQRSRAEWYANQARQGYDLLTARTDDGNRTQQIMDRFGSLRVPAWQRTPSAFPGWLPGGPGYSGLPPQVHEAGVEIPIEPTDEK